MGFLRLEAAGGLFIGWLPMGWGVLHILVLVAILVSVFFVRLGGTRSLFTRLKLKMREEKKPCGMSWNSLNDRDDTGHYETVYLMVIGHGTFGDHMLRWPR